MHRSVKIKCVFGVCLCVGAMLCRGGEIQSGNIVGYRNLNGQGVITNTVTSCGGSSAELSSLFNGVCDGTVLEYYIGSGPHIVVRARDDGDALHWYDDASDLLADDYAVPAGTVMHYRQPQGAKYPLSLVGQFPDPDSQLCDDEMRPLFSDGPTLNEIKPSPAQIIQALGDTLRDLTNNAKVVHLEHLPSRFVIRMRDDTERHARYDYKNMAIVDANTGKEISIGVDQVLCFDVETNATITAADRFTKQQIPKLEKAFLHRYEESTDKRAQQTVVKGIKEAVFSWQAFLTFVVGAIVAFFVNMFLDDVFKRNGKIHRYLFRNKSKRIVNKGEVGLHRMKKRWEGRRKRG